MKFKTYFQKPVCKLALIGLVLSITIFTIIILGYFAALEPDSYLPIYNADSRKIHKSHTKIIKISSPWYVLRIDEYGKVSVENPNGEVIMSDLKYYALYEGSEEFWGLDDISAELNNDDTISISGKGPCNTNIRFLLKVHKDLPKIDIYVKTNYNATAVINREAIVAEFKVPVSGVYRKNGQIDARSVYPEYWLQRRGAHFGNGTRSALIYHTPSVSSLQIDTKKNLLYVNLDYFLDHPFIHIPYQKDGGCKHLDLSKAKYSKGDERINHFSIYFGGSIPAIPRFMLLPDGYLAGYVFTEHADETTMKTQRAVYFGSEDITDINKAVGGFAGHKIPVTKSVFYTFAGKYNCVAINNSPDCGLFLDFLDQLNSTGMYDICLHTPDEGNSTREILEESIKFMKNRFNTVTWIDHGLFSGALNREAFAGDGLNPKSAYYCADLWEKYQTRYFWNFAFETKPYQLCNHSGKAIDAFKEMNLVAAAKDIWERYFSIKELEEIKLPGAMFKLLLRMVASSKEFLLVQTRNGESCPAPLYWRHPSMNQKFYSWKTDYETEFGARTKEKYYDNNKLNELVSNWGVFINHCYPPRIIEGRDDGFWIKQNGKIVVNPEFDKMLDHMSLMQKNGELLLTTIRDLLNYWIQIENITFDYKPDGQIIICNNNDKIVKGLSLAVRADAVSVNGKIPSFKKIGEDVIFWVDIPAGKKLNLKID